MGSIRDELIKKGLADEKRARAVTHEDKARQKRLGPEAVEAERKAREEEVRREAERKRVEDRQRESGRRLQHQQDRESNRIPDLIRAGLVREGAAGNRRFYFVTRENTISFLEVSDTASRNLADGRVGIVESGDVVRNDFSLVASEQVAEIAHLDAGRVRFWNGGGSGGGGSSSGVPARARPPHPPRP
jgi:uncharacterized protein YaiL (DUF2058 family)